MTLRLGMNDVGESRPRQIFGGDFPRVTQGVTLKAGALYPMGAVLGKITASGICTLVNSAASDGSQNIFAVLGEDVDATAANSAGAAYLTGQFIRDALTFGGSDTWETHNNAARDLNIFFVDAEVPADI